MSLDDKLLALLVGLLPDDIEVIFANENGRRPSKPYVTLQATAAERYPVHHTEVLPNGDRKLFAHQDFTLQVQAYGARCMERMNALSMALETEAGLGLADLLDLAWSTQPKIDNVPALLDNLSYEPRALLRIEGQHTLEITESVGFIETVNAAVSVSGGLSETSINFTASVVSNVT